MREIFIKHNPYKVETVITIDGKSVASNSELNFEDKRFQEWVEELPNLLVEECNTKDFSITFHGTLLDYEDLNLTIEEARKSGINIECNYIRAKEVSDKEALITEIFQEIQDGPFEELKQKDIKKAFELATKSEFEVNVVATMSAGKSTLINALLSKKIMPSKNESCTATISRIKDIDDENFIARVYDKNSSLIEVQPELSYEIMQKLNSDENVSIIDIEGDIPFVASDEMSLVLVDTPGPNNSRDENHKATTYRMLSESSKTLVLYVLNATQLAVDDDNSLLNNVAESMKIGGKQSKDRFIFVVNKIDTFRKGEDSVEESIEKVKKYLEDKGIKNPNIFPAAALPALDIREYLKYGDKTDEDLEEEIDYEMKKLIKNEEKHLEKYAPLTPSIKGKISNELAITIDEGNKYEEALIHTGIRSIEEYINMYVEKYAKTAKIKNIVDTFDKKLQTAESFEKSKQEIAANEDKHKEILQQINSIKEKINSGEEGKKFREKIDEINFDKDISCSAREITKEAQNRITNIQEKADEKITKLDAEYRLKEYSTFCRNLQAEIKVKLEDIITNDVQMNTKALMNEYTKRISSLTSELKLGDIKIDTFSLVQGDISTLEKDKELVNNLISTERVKVGEEWIENTNKKWYKPWTWLQDSGHYRDVFENVEYVDGVKLCNQFFAPIQASLIDNNKSAIEYAKKQSREVKKYFIKQFDEIDKVLQDKLNELQKYATDRKLIEEVLKESKDKLSWLENIQNKVKEILEV
ncbi:dynamin family protein [Clostridium butyricum]|uniref:dynamin family protein n=1 Tax=Clostridium butyricum TaxID=1492 RepID=UPI0024B94E32|nr:dynamin family protein [Clostridium butyricum]